MAYCCGSAASVTSPAKHSVTLTSNLTKTMICPTCRSFKRGSLPTIDLRASYSYQYLVNSAETCDCCDVLIKGCRGLLDVLGKSESDVKSCDLWLAFEVDDDSNEKDCQKLITLHLCTGQSLLVEFCALQDEADVPSSWHNMPTGYRAAGNTASDQAFQCIKDWIHECSTEHGECDHIIDRTLPTRLVDVGLEGGSVRVIESNGALGQYVTLSHCWGTEQIITSTKATLPERINQIRLEECSQTFYQAIQLTRRLKIPYIWIDSLCIVQDDKEDWARESSKMALYYQNSALTIAATSSSSGNGGLYRLHPDYVLAGVTSYEEPYQLIFRESIEHETMDAQYADLSKRFPLMTRGWVLQERLLSSRVVHFGPHELFFECRSLSDCECGKIKGFEIPDFMLKLMYAEALSINDKSWYIARVWRALVGLYTGLSLTYSKDILPAVGGLARQMSVFRSSKYAAGLWSDSMVDDLLWRAGPSKVRPNWRAPTWSWASTGHPVYYSDAPFFWDPDEAIEDRPPFEHISVVLGIETKAKFQDEFGELDSGRLRLKSRCATATLQYWNPNELGIKLKVETRPSREQKCMTYAVQMSDGSGYQIIPDYALEKSSPDFVPRGVEVLCVLMSIASNNIDAHRILYLLVLTRTGSEEEEFERIALCVVEERQGQDIDAVLQLFPKEMKVLTLI